jgi:hypothetical protein
MELITSALYRYEVPIRAKKTLKLLHDVYGYVAPMRCVSSCENELSLKLLGEFKKHYLEDDQFQFVQRFHFRHHLLDCSPDRRGVGGRRERVRSGRGRPEEPDEGLAVVIGTLRATR